MRSWDYMDGDQLPYSLRCGCSCVCSCFYSSYISSYHYGYKSSAYMFFSDQGYVCCFYHCIGSLNRGYQSFCFNHSKGLLCCHIFILLIIISSYKICFLFIYQVTAGLLLPPHEVLGLHGWRSAPLLSLLRL